MGRVTADGALAAARRQGRSSDMGHGTWSTDIGHWTWHMERDWAPWPQPSARLPTPSGRRRGPAALGPMTCVVWERARRSQYPPPRRTGRQFPRAAARQYPVAHGPLVPRGARAVSVPGWRPAPRVSTRDLVRRVRLTVRWPVKVRPTPAHAEAVARGRHRRADRARAGCPPRGPARATRLVRSGRRDMCRCATGRAPRPPAGPRVLPHRARPMPTPPAGGLRRGHNKILK